jgi:hypothetical protein
VGWWSLAVNVSVCLGLQPHPGCCLAAAATAATTSCEPLPTGKDDDEIKSVANIPVIDSVRCSDQIKAEQDRVA